MSAALGPEAPARGEGEGRGRPGRGGSPARHCPAGSQLDLGMLRPDVPGDCLPRLRGWSSKGEIALLHVIFYCLLQINGLAFISFFVLPSRFPPFFLFGYVQVLELYFFFFFLLLRTVENCPYEMKKDKDIFNLPFCLLNLLWEKILMQARMKSGKDHCFKSWLTLAFPCSLFLGHCLLKLAVLGRLLSGFKCIIFILKYNSEILFLLLLLRELFESVQLY